MRHIVKPDNMPGVHIQQDINFMVETGRHSEDLR